MARAVRNRCLNHLKSRAARYDWSQEIQDYQHPTDTAPDDTLQGTELTAALERILPQLPEKCGLVFSLIRYEERSYQEVADQLGVSVKAIEYHMGKALRLIRQHLARYGYGLVTLNFLEFLLGAGLF